jgi:hypothetical protein
MSCHVMCHVMVLTPPPFGQKITLLVNCMHIGTLCYLTTVSGHFPLSCLTDKALKCNEQCVCWMWHMAVSKGKHCKNLISTEIY